MNPFRWKTLTGILLAMLLTAPAWAVKAAAPGTVNYAEGNASLGNQPLDKDSIGAAELQPGQLLSTGAEGKVEVLLGPGVFLRLGDNSSARMLSNNPPSVELTKGQATVEVLPGRPGVVLVSESGATTRLVKNGLYEFDADQRKIFVYKGQAQVEAGTRTAKLKDGHAVDLNQSGNLKASKFDKRAFENSELVQFSGLRSEYLAEANADAAHAYYLNSAGWYGPGWYWDPEFYAYTWVPGDEMFYDPFGWGYYSPVLVFDDPFLFAGFFGDFGFDSFGHHRHGHERLPESFSARRWHGEQGFAAQRPPAMAGNAAATTGAGAFSHPAFNHSGFNRGSVAAGGFSGGGGMRGGTAGGAHAGAAAGGMGGAHATGGFGGGFGGVHR